MITFRVNGIEYRTNSNATIIEGHDGKKWNRTGSLAIHSEALKAIKACQTKQWESFPAASDRD